MIMLIWHYGFSACSLPSDADASMSRGTAMRAARRAAEAETAAEAAEAAEEAAAEEEELLLGCI